MGFAPAALLAMVAFVAAWLARFTPFARVATPVMLIVAMTFTLAGVFFVGYSDMLQQSGVLAKISNAVTFGIGVSLTTGIGNVAQYELGAILGSTLLGLLVGGGAAGLAAAACEGVFSSLAKESQRQLVFVGVLLIVSGVAIGVLQVVSQQS